MHQTSITFDGDRVKTGNLRGIVVTSCFRVPNSAKYAMRGSLGPHPTQLGSPRNEHIPIQTAWGSCRGYRSLLVPQTRPLGEYPRPMGFGHEVAAVRGRAAVRRRRLSLFFIHRDHFPVPWSDGDTRGASHARRSL